MYRQSFLKSDVTTDIQYLYITKSCTCNVIVSRDKRKSVFLFPTDCKDASQYAAFKNGRFANLSFKDAWTLQEKIGRSRVCNSAKNVTVV